MSNNFISALEEQFNKDCKVINIRYDEYEGFSGKERYIIASRLTEKEIWNKYPKQAKLYAPFVKVDLSFIEVRHMTDTSVRQKIKSIRISEIR